jgi:hypothetical protein
LPEDPVQITPPYDSLPVNVAVGVREAAGVFGANDQLGTINRLTPDIIVAAAAEIRTGEVIPLSLPLHLPGKAGGPASRQQYHHTIFQDPFPGPPDNYYQDDYLDGFYLQSSTQWDGLRHIRAGTAGFYNHVTDEQAGHDGNLLGIEHWAKSGILGRAVLADMVRFQADRGVPLDPFTSFTITPALLDEVLVAQGATRRPGDILLVRTGFASAFNALPEEHRSERRAERRWPGLSGSEDMARYLWDGEFAAVAADNVTVEVSPLQGVTLHIHLALLGFAMGEYFDLETLAARSAEDERYTCFLSAVPLHLVGGVGSPANAVAVR